MLVGKVTANKDLLDFNLCISRKPGKHGLKNVFSAYDFKLEIFL
jgi:hypothetical protein